MKRIIAATIVLASLTGGVFAQTSKDDDEPIKMEQRQKKLEAEAVDKRYQSTLDKTRKDTAATPVDPWSNIRGASDAKPKR